MTKLFQKSFSALGTSWLVKSSSPISPNALVWLNGFESRYSRFQEKSFLNYISHHPGTYTIDDDGVKILTLYQTLNKITNNLFTPLIGQNLVEAGYDSHYSLTPKKLTPLPELDDVISLSQNQLTIKKPIRLDFGGIGKGYAIDYFFNYLSPSDYKYINAGGDIYLKSQLPEKIALEHPDDPQQAIGLAILQTGSLCGSSGNRRRWANFHHILNPQTQTSPQHLKAVWVTAKTATIADALATCLFLVSPSVLTPHFDFEYLLLDNQFKVTQSKNFPSQLFYA